MPSSIEGKADYWKKYYNTEGGKGDPEHFEEVYQKYIQQENKMPKVGKKVYSYTKKGVAAAKKAAKKAGKKMKRKKQYG